MPDTVFTTDWDNFEKFLTMAGQIVRLKGNVDKAEIEVGNIRLEAVGDLVQITIKELVDPTPP